MIHAWDGHEPTGHLDSESMVLVPFLARDVRVWREAIPVVRVKCGRARQQGGVIAGSQTLRRH